MAAASTAFALGVAFCSTGVVTSTYPAIAVGARGKAFPSGFCGDLPGGEPRAE